MNAGHLAEAQRTLLKARAQTPEDISIKIALGKLDTLLGRSSEAVQLFREIETQLPSDNENQVNLAIALAAQGSLQDALVHATAATGNLPRSSPAHHIRGKILDGLGRNAEAQAEYEASLQINPTDPLTLYDFAVLCENSGQLPKEVSLLQQLIQLQPKRAQLHFLLGRALARTGSESMARDEFREAIRLDPNHRAAIYNLSRALIKDDPQESARLSARFKTLRLSEDETNLIRDQGNQGVAASQARDWPRAIAIFQAALTTCAGCALEATLEKDLGLAQCQGGDTQSGAASLRRALALNPNDLDTLQAIDLAERSNSKTRK